jgi:flagellar biogenesis protein FliO
VIDAAQLLRFLAAFAVIGLALFGFTLLSRNGARVGTLLRRGRIVEVIETTPLPHASSLHVVKVGESYLVIGRTDHGISVLTEVPKDVIDRRETLATARTVKLLPFRFRAK